MVHAIYPVLMTENLEESRLFYKTYFGFAETFSSDWYVSLLHPDGCELALIDVQHETIPASSRIPVRGMILNIEVEDATKMYGEISKKNDKILILPLRDEEYGQRHFMVQDPNHLIIDVIETIPPGKEFQDSFIAGKHQDEK